MTLLDLLPQRVRGQGSWAYFLISPQSTCSAWITYSEDLQGIVESDLLTPLDLVPNGTLPPGVYLWQGEIEHLQPNGPASFKGSPRLVLLLGNVEALKDLN
jgi:hypothetical protein